VGDEAVAVASRIKHMIEAPKSPALVAGYFDTTSSFSGGTFDPAGTNDPCTFSVDDLLALTMLDVGLKPPAVRALLGPGQVRLSELPRAIPHDQRFCEARGTPAAPPMTCSSNSTPSPRWGR